jgi:thioredoxin 1
MTTRHVRAITEDEFSEEVLRSLVPVLVDFASAWCPPCRALDPILDRIAAEAAGQVKVVSVAGDEFPSLVARFAVNGYPTVVAFSHGQERARQLGVTSRDNLLRMLEACR